MFAHSKIQGSLSLHTREITNSRYSNIRALFAFKAIFLLLFFLITLQQSELRSHRAAHYNCLTGIVISESSKFKEPWTPTLIKDRKMLLYAWFKFLILH